MPRSSFTVRRFVLPLCAVVFALLCACSAKPEAGETSPGLPVATVNGETVTAAEYTYFEGRLRSAVMSELLEAHDIEYSDGFWQTPLGGKTPAEVLHERTLEQAVRAKLQLVLMRDKGIYSDISYSGLYAAAESYNEENSTKSGVVGVNTIRLDSFYTYYLDTGAMELKSLLADTLLLPSEEDILTRAEALADAETNAQAFYNAAKNQLIDEAYEAMVDELYENKQISVNPSSLSDEG